MFTKLQNKIGMNFSLFVHSILFIYIQEIRNYIFYFILQNILDSTELIYFVQMKFCLNL